jgi:glycosyltransferase involved in cell wall biosynthesis
MSGQAKNKKVSIWLNNSYDPDVRAKFFADFFIENGYEITIVALRNNFYADYYWKEDIGQISLMRPFDRVPKIPLTVSGFKNALKVISTLRADDSDAFFVTSYRYLPYLALFTKKKKIIMDDMASEELGIFYKLFLQLVKKRIIKQIFCSNYEKLKSSIDVPSMIITGPLVVTQVGWADTGGQGMRMARYFREHTGNNFRVFSLEETKHFGYVPRMDLDFDLLDASLRRSGVILCNDLSYKVKGIRGKTFISYHRGTAYRSNPLNYKKFDDEANLVIVSTIDLLKINKNSFWLPSIADIDLIRSFRIEKKRKPGDPFVVAHSTISLANSETRKTKMIESAVGDLRKEGFNIVFNHIHDVPYAESLRIRAEADVSVDHLGDMSYGNGTIEAMALGIPVIKKAHEEDLASEVFGEVPYIAINSEKELKAELKKLLTDPAYSESYVNLGLKHVNRFHHPEVCARRLEYMCRTLLRGEKVTQKGLLSDHKDNNQGETKLMEDLISLIR